MSSSLQELLSKYRSASRDMRELGTYFERLSKVYLENDALLSPQFKFVQTYQEWAKDNEKDARDVGIDLVAKLADEDGFCAIQCKFYDEDYRIQKGDIDSFFTASGVEPFKRRLIIDTTRKAWSENAENALVGQIIPVNRIGLDQLEQSSIDWSQFARDEKVHLKAKKSLRQHQQAALKAVQEGLDKADRGKLIMACGTGKTFTSLRIAEMLAGKGKNVLYLVPSLALMSQTVREWSNDAEVPLRSFAACSDAQVGKRQAKDDLSDINVHDLAYPATTNSQKIAEKFADVDGEKMNVVFATYQSINVISFAQQEHGLPEFDLIICDEAHRTTGVTLAGEDDSNFVLVHNQDVVQGKKRLYMTATPRIFSENIKAKASEADAVLCSMNDESLYGETLYEVSFSYAVENELLTDYKVIVLAVNEEDISASVQKRLSSPEAELNLDDVTKIIGCYRALNKTDFKPDVMTGHNPMHRAVAFCKSIKDSKRIEREFASVVDEYLDSLDEDNENLLQCEIEHVDGTFNAKERGRLLDWLNAEAGEETCRILTNARCLSEGVDVPALDAIMFLHPRKSQIDVVQSVGRVMRRAEGKSMGYVILPVGIPAGVSPEEALNNNDKYKVVWQILNALRSHDDRFDSVINRIDLGEDVSSHIEVVAVSDYLPQRKNQEEEKSNIGHGSTDDGDFDYGDSTPKPKPDVQYSLEFDDFHKAIMARIVKKCGTREYWEDWAKDIADIAKKHITRINAILKEPDTKARKAFEDFLEEIQDDLNESITKDDAIEMLAQHLITKPVFEALFDDYAFTKHNPVSRAMQKILDVLEEHQLDNENKSLEKFYASVRRKASGIDSDTAKQQIIVKLYDKFFKNAFPRMTEKLGIVYTPVEVVDFIIHSVNDVLQEEFGQTLGSKGVHILDPFTGTGTFITRLMQSGLIKPEELAYKYQNEIHANEIVLLAYYIAAINIEAAYHGLAGGDYVPFNGICLTDTFQLYEKEDMISRLLVDNSNRRQKQKELDIRVIMGNPPYSGGQKREDDNNANVGYSSLDSKIANSYGYFSKASTTKPLYDPYIRAVKWGTERIGESGIMAYVSNAGWIDGNAMDGLRKCLQEDFSSLYIFHLRGNQRTSGERSKKEGGKIFGSGSRSPIAITLYVKNPEAKEHGKIYFHDIGDYLSQKQKLNIIENFKSVTGIENEEKWQEIKPNNHGDWLEQRDDSFNEFIVVGDKDRVEKQAIFCNYSQGVLTSRDPWCYNGSATKLFKNIHTSISFYNSEAKKYSLLSPHDKKNINIKEFVTRDPRKFSWSSSTFPKLEKGIEAHADFNNIVQSMYRPFCKEWLYYDDFMNHRLSKMRNIFPRKEIDNRCIVTTGVAASRDFSAFMSDVIPNFHTMDTGQCFPLKLYEKVEHDENSLFSNQQVVGYDVKDGITDEGLAHFQEAYPDDTITKEDLFYYIYGLLHSTEYREKYADNLSKQLPRIPRVKTAADFWAFSKAGRKLADLHVDYEQVDMYPVIYKGGKTLEDFTPEDFRVEKMKFGKSGKDKDKSTIIYNHKITLTGVPLEAYDYVVNGKPAIEWVMERQGVKKDKASGIVNDANDYATETVGDAAYPLKLLQRVITVSLETMKIVNALPKLEIEDVEMAA